jgi:hypothetical protein
MAFPLSPANNQIALVNGIEYYYNTTKGAWYRYGDATANVITSNTFQVLTSVIYPDNTIQTTASVQGASGVAGATGAGVQGASGATGAAGSQGASGATGIQGASGSAGTNGATGISGATGSAGTNGATGSAGTNGTNGATGAQGASGAAGSQGASGATGTQGASGATGVIQNWIVKTTTYTAINKDAIAADTTGGAFTITLPASPAAGHFVAFADSGHSFNTNNLTIGRNGSTIENSATDLIVDVSNIFVTLIYDGTTWKAFSTVGTQGASGATGTQGASGIGATGSAGANGATGPSGASGVGGATGVPNTTYLTRIYQGTGSQTAFTVTTGQTANSVIVFENGVCQVPVNDYTVNGTTLTFTTAPTSDKVIQIRELPIY